MQGAAGQALATSLIQKNGATIGELAAKFGYIDPTEISIASDGSVVITNAEVASQVKAISSAEPGVGVSKDFIDINCTCVIPAKRG